jgi:O-antigen ligase
LWVQALKLFSENPLFGYGSPFWVSEQQASILNANNSTHNFFTEFFVPGELVGTALFVLAVFAMLL